MRRFLLPMLFVVLALASCGGGGGGDDAEALLDRAFGKEIVSADLKLEAEVQLEGSPMLERPLRIQASGPLRRNRRKLPSVDLELKIGTAGAGQTVTTGFLSTGDRAFLKFQDVYYEQPRAAVRRVNRSLAQIQGRRAALLGLGLNPRSWLSDVEEKGEEEVAGVQTRHVTGTLDVEALMLDVNRFLLRPGSAVGGAIGRHPLEPLSRKEIREIGQVITDPNFDAYMGSEDGIVRRLAGGFEFDVPADSRRRFHGIEAGRIEFSVELADVNGDQQIEAPAKARPLSKLMRYLGRGGVLGALGGGADAPSDDTPGELPPRDGDLSPEAQRFRDYAECLDEARPEDTDAIQRCAELLETP
ncbi:MAG: hypothetical protein ICV69_06470 [Thermoleophilaceae bacterium]|nr:hypothetical protein [Thermoleophilaceae bacterium]